MLNRALKVEIPFPAIDTCGTGGDGSHSFNISTAAAFIAAGCNLKVAKHGNRAVSSTCGSADILEALGANIALEPNKVKRCLEEVGFGFIFAPLFHPAMKGVAQYRRELGIRTMFNILGPLTNPARVKAQVLGVAEESLVLKLIEVLKLLGSQHAWVVYGEDGLDEITLGGKTLVAQLKGGEINTFFIYPEELGLRRASKEEIRGGSAEENAEKLIQILSGKPGALTDICLLNAAAALVVGDKAKDLKEGLAMAKEAIDSRRALKRLQEFIALTKRL
jgi:anthranilate phosphoribosyltransferase